jgi:chromosomal replication initiator protein
MAHAAAVAVAEHFGTAYNPLFLYGGVGVGKTHLAHAVALKYLEAHPAEQMIYCMSEEFTNGIIEAIQQKKTHEFRRRYRKVRGLFIDDIQFIAGKTTVQEEFFHTFNAVLKAGGQVVMTSDRPPSEIPHLEARLRSRFEAGLLVDIGKPDFELKTAIALIKAEQRKINLTMEQAQIIAANVESARQVEGFLTRLTTEIMLKHRTLDVSLIQSLLGKTQLIKDDSPPPLRPLEVMKGVARYFDITPKQLRGERRVKQLVTPRHIAMYLLRVDYKLPLTEIGLLFTNRDHTTVMHAVDKITTLLKDQESLRMNVGEIRKLLYT